MFVFSNKGDIIHKMDCLHRFLRAARAKEDAEFTQILVITGSSCHPLAWEDKREEAGLAGPRGLEEDLQLGL